MKLTILVLILMTFISCGKKNESGQSQAASKYQAAYTAEEEEKIRQSFMRKGSELLRTYEMEMKFHLGARTVGLIRNKLKMERVIVSDRLVYDQHRRFSRASHQDNFVVLYIGHEEPALSWGNFRKWSRLEQDRAVMHELVSMGNVNDRDLEVTDRILSLR